MQAGHWFSEGITNWSSGLTDTVSTGLTAVQQLWANADASMKAASEESSKSDVQVQRSFTAAVLSMVSCSSICSFLVCSMLVLSFHAPLKVCMTIVV